MLTSVFPAQIYSSVAHPSAVAVTSLRLTSCTRRNRRRIAANSRRPTRSGVCRIRQPMVSSVDNRRELATPSTAISSIRGVDLQRTYRVTYHPDGGGILLAVIPIGSRISRTVGVQDVRLSPAGPPEQSRHRVSPLFADVSSRPRPAASRGVRLFVSGLRFVAELPKCSPSTLRLSDRPQGCTCKISFGRRRPR